MSSMEEKKRKIENEYNIEDNTFRSCQQELEFTRSEQINDDKKDANSKKTKKVKSRKRHTENPSGTPLEMDCNSFDRLPEQQSCESSQDINSTSSDEIEKHNVEIKMSKNKLSHTKVNLKEFTRNIDTMRNVNEKNDFNESELELCQQTDGSNLEKFSQLKEKVNESKTYEASERSPIAENYSESKNEILEKFSSVQNNSLISNCDIEESNNFEKGFATKTQMSSTSPPTTDGCAPSIHLNKQSSFTDCNTPNVDQTLMMQAENLSPQNHANEPSSTPSLSIWHHNVHHYNNARLSTPECFESANISEKEVPVPRISEVNEFEQEYNRLQENNILSKLKNEEDHVQKPENQQQPQQELINQTLFQRTHNENLEYRNAVHEQQEDLQSSYGSMFNAVAHRPQQQHPNQYSQEQEFYQMRLQQQHGSLLHQHQSNLNLQDEQLLAYIHHQQQPNRTQQDSYRELVMDEFHDEGNANASANLYKLQLSPATKHENQDDGYETSAGDVLTPNSHSSSTHSGTPQSLTVSQHVPPTSGLALHNLPHMQAMQQTHTQSHMPAPTTPATLNNSFSPGTPTCASEDPYKFHDETNAKREADHNFCMPTDPLIHNQAATSDSNQQLISDVSIGKPPQKRRGRKKKATIVEGICGLTQSGGIGTGGITDSANVNLAPQTLVKVKERKKHDRFNGMSEEEVVKRTLPDHLCHNLDIIMIGINPGLFAAYKGHHYAGPGNHFWKCLYLSGLTQEQMSADEDYKLIKYGIGFTNMVQRATKGSADLTRKEIKEGSRILLEKLQKFQPKIAVFNGKLIFEVFSGKKDFHFGRQPDCVEGTNTYVWVMPSSSARCAQLPRAADKVPFYTALKKFKDYLNGLISHISDEECVFTEQRIREMCEQDQERNIAQGQQSNNGTSCVTQQHDSAENANGGPGPPSIMSKQGNFIEGSPALNFQQPEKKKRGRPKKLKMQEIIDPNTGERIQISNQQQQSINDGNILNLSMVVGETPKKKRGRPKKVKMLGLSTGSDEAGNSTSTQAHNPQQHSLFTNSPQNISVQQLSGFGSTLNNLAMGTPPLNISVGHHTTERISNGDVIGGGNKQHHIEAPLASPPASSLPPGSPNACAVDFEPPNTSVERNSSEHDLATALHQQSQRNNSFNQWMPATPQQHFNYTPDEHQHQSQYQNDRNLNIQMHHQQQQQSSPHATWAPTTHSNFDAAIENNPRQTHQHHHFLMNTNQNEQRQHTLHQRHNIDQQQQSASTDVAAKSLSGLESLVEQIPTIAESEAAAAAAVESRLQALQRDSTPVSLSEQLQTETAYETRGINEATSNESRNSSSNGGNNTPQHYNGAAIANGGGPSSCSSPTISHHMFNNNNIQRHQHSQASSAASSPHAHSQQQQQQYSSVASSFSDHNTGADMLVASSQTPPLITSSTLTTNSTTSATTSHLFSNFSVSHLAASSCNSSSNNSKNSDWPPGCTTSGAGAGTGSPYHHSNLMAAAAIQLTTSPHHQMYIDHHHSHHAAAHLAHASPHQHHMQVNSFYPPGTQSHHHPVAAYGTSPAAGQHSHMHNAGSDYGAYGATAAHMIHMPSPNYPAYGYGTPPPTAATVTTQNSYSSWNHHHHHPSAVPSHHSHHLSMFERLKPSDIGSYTGF